MAALGKDAGVLFVPFVAIVGIAVRAGSEVVDKGSIILYRAVSEPELDDIADFGGFRQRPDGGTMEAKLFTTSAEDAAAYGRDLHKFDRQPFAIVEAMIPNSLAGKLYELETDFRQTVAVYPELLPEFNAAARVRVPPSVPLGWRYD